MLNKLNRMEHKGALTLEESDLILRSTLMPQHYSDPNIIKFIINYISNPMVSLAARAANISQTQAYNMLRMQDVDEAITKLTSKSVTKYGIRADSIIRQVRQMTEANIFDFLDSNGRPLPKDMIPRELQMAAKEFKVKVTYMRDINGVETDVPEIEIYDIKLEDRYKGIDKLAIEEDIFKTKTVVEHEVGKRAGQLLHGDSIRRAEKRRIEMAQARDVSPRRSDDE